MKKILIVIAILFSLNYCWAQKNYEPIDHYNYKIARAAIDEGDYDKAFDYLSKEIQQYPTNGYAYYWAASLYAYYKLDAKAAYTAIEKSLSNLPKKDKSFRSSALRLCGDLFAADGQEKTAMEAYSRAIKILPKDYRNYTNRAHLLYKNELYRLAANDYLKANALAKYEEQPYLGVARCLYQLGKKQESIKVLEDGLRVNPQYSEFYACRATFYFLDKEYEKATDDVVKALKIDGNNTAYGMLEELATKDYSRLVVQLTVEQNTDKTDIAWPYYLGIVHSEAKQYNKAFASWYKVYEMQPEYATQGLSDTWYEIGDYTTALKYINEAISVDSSISNIYRRAIIEDALGLKEMAYKDCEAIVNESPQSFFGYYVKACLELLNDDNDQAIDDYNIVIGLSPCADAYMSRGLCYREKDMLSLAKMDFEKAIEMDTVPSENAIVAFAYYYLDKPVEAKKRLELYGDNLNDNDKSNYYYNTAVLYSLQNDHEKAIFFFKKLLESGYSEFQNVERDKGFDNIRSDSAYIALVEEYKNKLGQNIEQLRQQYGIVPDESTNYTEKTQEIPFTRQGGVCEVKCSINELPLYFIFDTGASDVTISQVEATFMMKNKYLNASDIVGRRNYMTANGDITEGTVINLRSVKFGDAVLSNVRATVVKSQSAPLLLGQSVLERLGKIEIDNTRKVLKITYKEKK